MSQSNLLKQQTGVPENPRHIAHQQLAGLLSRKQVAQILGTCIHTVARNKQLTPIKFNTRLLRYRAEDVEQFIQSAAKQ
jgi:hypothetical protein